MNDNKNQKKIDTLLINYRNIFDTYSFSENKLGDKQIKGYILNNIIEKFTNKQELSELLKPHLNWKNFNFYIQLIEILGNYYNKTTESFEFLNDNDELYQLNKEELKTKIRKKLNLDNNVLEDSLEDIKEINIFNQENKIKVVNIEIFFKSFLEYNEFILKNNFIKFWENKLEDSFQFPLIWNLSIILKETENVIEEKFKINKILNESVNDILEDLKNLEIVMFFKEWNYSLENKIELFKERMSNNTKKFKVTESSNYLEYELKNKVIEEKEPIGKNDNLNKVLWKIWELYQILNYNNPWFVWFFTAWTPVLLLNTTMRIIVWLAAAYFNKKHIDKIKQENGDYYRIQVPKLRENNVLEEKIENLKESLAEKLIWKDRIKK